MRLTMKSKLYYLSIPEILKALFADMSISTPDQLDTWLLTDYVTTQKGE